MRPRYEVKHFDTPALGGLPFYYVLDTQTGDCCYSCGYRPTEEFGPNSAAAARALVNDAAQELAAEDARKATVEGLRRIGVAVAVWAGMAAVQQRAVSVVASEPEYLDAESYSSDARADLIAAGFEHPDEVFVMLVQIARGAVTDTKRCILERLPIAGPRGVLP